MNVGGPSISVEGQVWQADSRGGKGRLRTVGATSDIAGTTADQLYRSQRQGEFAYKLPVSSPGLYETRLHFAELRFGAEGRRGGTGSRVFSVNLEGGPVELSRYDIAGDVGPMHAAVKVFTATVNDGKLNLSTSAEIDEPALSAVEVLRVVPGQDCSPTNSTEGAATTPTPAVTSPQQSPDLSSPSSPTTSTTAGSPTSAAQPGSPQTATPTPPTTQPTTSPTTSPATAPPATTPATGGLSSLTADGGRPFAATAAWNTVIPDRPVLDPNSAAMVAGVTPNDRAYANLYEFGVPIFTAKSDTPLASVNCTMDWGTCDLEGRKLRIPSDAHPNSGSDGAMIIVDLVARTTCDFWQAKKVSASQWNTSWGSCTSLDGDGRAAGTGAGVSLLAGMVRTHEIANGNIPHALSIATNNSCRSGFRYPATKTDGSSSLSNCVPEGARLQLDPAIDVDAIPGITPGEKAVARALQTYGAINRDNSGAPIAVGFEAPTSGPDPYPAAGFSWDYYDMPHIPWNRLQVLRQWDGG